MAPAPPSAAPPSAAPLRRRALRTPGAGPRRARPAPRGIPLLGRDFARRRQAQLYVVAQILDVLEADRNPKQPRGDAARRQCHRIQLAMGR